VELARGSDARLDRAVVDLKAELANADDAETRARRVVGRMAVALQGSLLVRYGDPAVADAFCASRLDGDRGHSLGTLPPGTKFTSIVERHRPATN
jgi:putative acyl-CoA dehydrogenase